MGAQDIISSIDGSLSQTGRLLKLDSPLGTNVLLPQRLVGHSRLGRHYEFTLDAISVDSDIERKTLIAQPVTLWIQQTDQAYAPHHGYVYTAHHRSRGARAQRYASMVAAIRPGHRGNQYLGCVRQCGVFLGLEALYGAFEYSPCSG
jgi:type VI secretion system secreted protein VgrG